MTKNHFSFIKQVAEIHLCFTPTLEETPFTAESLLGLWDGPVPLGNSVALMRSLRSSRVTVSKSTMSTHLKV